jgi:hypothetical protein
MYLSGHLRPSQRDPRVGLMLSFRGAGYAIPEGMQWAADNGCFSRPEDFTVDGFVEWIAQKSHAPLFAVAPDVVGDHSATVWKSLPAMPQIRRVCPVAFVAQDGATSARVPWPEFDVLFVGGSTAWKISENAFALVSEAKRRGLWVHAGRVNSFRRLKAFADAGADSADGTFVAFGPDKNWPRLCGWLDRLDRELTFMGVTP